MNGFKGISRQKRIRIAGFNAGLNAGFLPPVGGCDAPTR
jgi:hypothetical protein